MYLTEERLTQLLRLIPDLPAFNVSIEGHENMEEIGALLLHLVLDLMMMNNRYKDQLEREDKFIETLQWYSKARKGVIPGETSLELDSGEKARSTLNQLGIVVPKLPKNLLFVNGKKIYD